MNFIRMFQSPAPIAKIQYWCGVKWLIPDANNPIYPQDKTNSLSKEAKKTRYIITNKSLLWFARAGSELAGEPFYYIFFPACSWIFEIHLSRKCLIMLAAVMYVGQCLKDILRWPRPSSPPVIRLDEAYETEYGMPSTHTMCAVTVPLTLLLFLSQTYEIPMLNGIALAVLWIAPVIFSRIYLGMHSVLDILVGTVLSGILVKLFDPIVSWIEEAQFSNANHWSASLSISAFYLAWIIFKLDSTVDPATGKPKWNTARGDTAEILGWCVGFLAGSSSEFADCLMSAAAGSHFITTANSNPALRYLLRFAAGGVLLGPASLLLRKLLRRCCMSLKGMTNVEEAKRERWIELPYKFLATYASGLISTALVPPLLQRFNLW